MTNPSPRRFLVAFLAWCLAPVALIGAFNLLVDPFALLPAAGIAGINAHKPMLRDRERLFKPFAVARLHPEALIFGTSRSNHALDPAHPAFAGMPAYNFSVSGTNIREARTMFEHAVANGTVKLAVLELDMGMFDPDAAVALDYLDTPVQRRPLARLGTLLSTAFSWNTFPQSIATLRSQDEGDEYTGLGRQTERVFRWRIASYGGVRNTFEGYMQRLAPAEQQQAAAWQAGAVNATNFPGMDELHAVVELARQHHIRLLLYVSPIHAIDLEAVHTIYGWPLLEAWKRAVLQVSRAYPGFDVEFWDFSGYNAVTTEALPARDDAAGMSYYWDQSHYRVPVGNWVLERMFSVAPQGAPIPQDFGVLLTPTNMEAQFATTRAAAAAYALEHPVESAFVRGLTAAGRQKP